MDELLKNLKNYVKIFDSSRTEQVSKWKLNDLERALSWSQHFENFSKKLKNSKPHFQQQFADELKSHFDLPHYTPPLLVLNDCGKLIEFLENSQQLLIRSLLENSSLPDHLLQTIKERFPADSELTLDDDLQLYRSLSSLQSTILNDTMLPAVRGDSLVTSVALMGEFKLLMSFQYPINIKIEQLRERFSDISSHADGYEALLVCLTLNSEEHHHQLQMEILQWIEDNIDKLLSVPPQVLAYVSEKSPRFFQLYYKHLAAITDTMYVVASSSDGTYISSTTTAHCSAATTTTTTSGTVASTDSTKLSQYWECLKYTNVDSIRDKVSIYMND